MCGPPPHSTRTDTPFPYTPLFGSIVGTGMNPLTRGWFVRGRACAAPGLSGDAKEHERVENEPPRAGPPRRPRRGGAAGSDAGRLRRRGQAGLCREAGGRSEEHTSELQSLMRISYAGFCLKKKKDKKTTQNRF